MNEEDGYQLSPKDLSDVKDERQRRKERLAGSLRIFGRFGFDEGVAGHITVRDPELSDHFWVNPMGRAFKLMKVSDLLLVDHSGTVVEGSGLLNGAAFTIHSQIHLARPDVNAACWWFISMERSCQAQLLAEAVGNPISIDAKHALETHKVVGSHLAGWFSFQPLFDVLLAEEPDFLD